MSSIDWERLYLKSDGDPAAIKRALMQLARETGITEFGELPLEQPGPKAWKQIILALLQIQSGEYANSSMTRYRVKFVEHLKPILKGWPLGSRPAPIFEVGSSNVILRSLANAGLNQLIDTAKCNQSWIGNVYDSGFSLNQLRRFSVFDRSSVVRAQMPNLRELSITAQLLNNAEQAHYVLKCTRLNRMAIFFDGQSMDLPILKDSSLRTRLKELRLIDVQKVDWSLFSLGWPELEVLYISLSSEIDPQLSAEALREFCPRLKSLKISLDCRYQQIAQVDWLQNFYADDGTREFQPQRLGALDAFLHEFGDPEEFGIDLQLIVSCWSECAADFAPLSECSLSKLTGLHIWFDKNLYLPPGLSRLSNLKLLFVIHGTQARNLTADIDPDFISRLRAISSQLTELHVNAPELSELLLLRDFWPFPKLETVGLILSDSPVERRSMGRALFVVGDRLAPLLSALARLRAKELRLTLRLESSRPVEPNAALEFNNMQVDSIDLDCRLSKKQLDQLISGMKPRIHSLRIDCGRIGSWQVVRDVLTSPVYAELRELSLENPRGFGAFDAWRDLDLDKLEMLIITSEYGERLERVMKTEMLHWPSLLRLYAYSARNPG